MRAITVHLEEQDIDYLKAYSKRKAGKESISNGLRMLVHSDRQSYLNEIDVQAKTIK